MEKLTDISLCYIPPPVFKNVSHPCQNVSSSATWYVSMTVGSEIKETR